MPRRQPQEQQQQEQQEQNDPTAAEPEAGGEVPAEKQRLVEGGQKHVVAPQRNHTQAQLYLSLFLYLFFVIW